MSEPVDPIELNCLGCKRQHFYPRAADEKLPPNVARIDMTSCDQCAGGGDFSTEFWYDEAGRVIEHGAYEGSASTAGGRDV